MRIKPTLLALALVSGTCGLSGVSVAATNQAQPTPAPTTAPMAPKAPSQSNTATPKLPSLKDCNKQADAKDLTGKERASFIKDCKAGKTSPDE